MSSSNKKLLTVDSDGIFTLLMDRCVSICVSDSV